MTTGGVAPAVIEPVVPAHERELAAFFEALVESGDEAFFHPHPLSAEEAGRRARYSGRDVYLVLRDEFGIAAYGMLRGWDEGYEVPSLGIAVHPRGRGRGTGRTMMRGLHEVAAEHGAGRVRLKVDAGNVAARRLYESLGYDFRAEPGGGLIGYVDLPA